MTRIASAARGGADLPDPHPAAREASERLSALIREEIATRGGWIAFDRYMALALHHPGLGYYAGGAWKFGEGGDFVTAPELTPLFARALAAQIGPLLAESAPALLEFGAGSGVLAADLLAALEARGALPARYSIVELSATLRERQAATLRQRVPQLAARVEWLDRLPARFDGVVLANEVLDAMPVCVLQVRDGDIDELGAGYDAATRRFVWKAGPARDALRAQARELALPAGYVTEIGLATQAFAATLAAMLGRGAALLIDYGFPAREYYHPQRSRGTLMCHYRHRAHDDPFHLVGLQDITAHVDFSAVARAAREGGLDVLGYSGQAQFLINCGIVDLLGESDPADARTYAPRVAAVQKLLSPAEMGELFKVLALGRGIATPLRGFVHGDRRTSL